MTDWSAIGANEPPDHGDPAFYEGDSVREKLEAIAVVAATFLQMFAYPGHEESALTTIYALANAALDELPTPITKETKKDESKT